jgi:hypothetical protein
LNRKRRPEANAPSAAEERIADIHLDGDGVERPDESLKRLKMLQELQMAGRTTM